MSQLQFDLLNNAKDSLVHAVHLLAWPDSTPSNKYKQALLSASHCTELLLKERLRRINPALVLQNVDKYPSSTAWTVKMETALSRLTNIGNVRISDNDCETVMACKNLRNLIQHFELDIPEREARLILGKVLSFVFAFAKEELNVNFREGIQDR
jgi:hypothetical protein